MSGPVDELRPLLERVLDATATPGELWHVCHRMHDLLREIAGLRAEEVEPAVAVETRLLFGTAIAPQDAARCVTDLARTQAFCRAVVAAVDRAGTRSSGAVHVVYAGCGPFATLLLPALHRFGPDELTCTLVDVHEVSHAAVGRVVDELGFGGQVLRIELADAATLRLPARPAVDVIVVECLLRGLTREPQVAITWNLLDQAPDATLVPLGIDLRIAAVSRSAWSSVAQPEIVRLDPDPVFTLDAEAVRSWGPPGPRSVPGRSMRWPEPPDPDFDHVLATEIRVSDDLVLTDHESGLTHPTALDVDRDRLAGRAVTFEYDLTVPGLIVRPDDQTLRSP